MIWIKTANGAVVVVAGGKTYSLAPDHAHMKYCLLAIKADDEKEFIKWADIPKAIQAFTAGTVEVKDNKVFFQGHEVQSDNLTERIKRMIADGFSPIPLMRFLENVRANVRFHVNHRLFNFLENLGMPITPAGTFIGYKSVKPDFMDWYSGKYDNTPGKTVEMPAREVDDNWNIDCSAGFHVGSLEYARGFHGGGTVILVEVHPADVVTVPPEGGYHSKLRCWRYRVIQQHENTQEFLGKGPIYSSTAPVVPLSPQMLEKALTEESRPIVGVVVTDDVEAGIIRVEITKGHGADCACNTCLDQQREDDGEERCEECGQIDCECEDVCEECGHDDCVCNYDDDTCSECGEIECTCYDDDVEDDDDDGEDDEEE